MLCMLKLFSCAKTYKIDMSNTNFVYKKKEYLPCAVGFRVSAPVFLLCTRAIVETKDRPCMYSSFQMISFFRCFLLESFVAECETTRDDRNIFVGQAGWAGYEFKIGST